MDETRSSAWQCDIAVKLNMDQSPFRAQKLENKCCRKRQKGERGGILNTRQCQLFSTYLQTGKIPPIEHLQDAKLVEEGDSNNTNSNRQGRLAKFKSWAHRMYVRGTDGELIHKATGKVIIPLEKFVPTIMNAHRHCVADGTLLFSHRSANATFFQIQKTYTIGKRNFGMTEEEVKRVVKSCRLGSCKALRRRRKKQERKKALNTANQPGTAKTVHYDPDTTSDSNEWATSVTKQESHEQQLHTDQCTERPGLPEDNHIFDTMGNLSTQDNKSHTAEPQGMVEQVPLPTSAPLSATQLNANYQLLIPTNNFGDSAGIMSQTLPIFQSINMCQPNIFTTQRPGFVTLLNPQSLAAIGNLQKEMYKGNIQFNNGPMTNNLNLKLTDTATTTLLPGFSQVSQNTSEQNNINMCFLPFSTIGMGASITSMDQPTLISSTSQTPVPTVMSTAIQIPVVSFKTFTDHSSLENKTLSSKQMAFLSTPPRKAITVDDQQIPILCTPSPTVKGTKKKGLPTSGTKRKLRQKIASTKKTKHSKKDWSEMKTKRCRRSQPCWLKTSTDDSKSMGCRVNMNENDFFQNFKKRKSIGDELETDQFDSLKPVQQQNSSFMTSENYHTNVTLGLQEFNQNAGRNSKTCTTSTACTENPKNTRSTTFVKSRETSQNNTKTDLMCSDQNEGPNVTDDKSARYIPQSLEQGFVPYPSIWTSYKDILAEKFCFARLLLVIYDMQQDMMKTYLNDSIAAERLKKKIAYAENLVKKHKAFIEKHHKT